MRIEPQELNVSSFPLGGTGKMSTDGTLPLLYYQRVIPPSKVTADAFEELLAENGWVHSWRNGVYGFHHYHANTHEVLGIYNGTAVLQFGGENGIEKEVGVGDAVIIPSGVVHKNLGSSFRFGVVGAYPRGQRMDMCYGQKGQRPGENEIIARVPLPPMDPFCGERGPLIEIWH